jgi:hypothetical protein
MLRQIIEVLAPKLDCNLFIVTKVGGERIDKNIRIYNWIRSYGPGRWTMSMSTSPFYLIENKLRYIYFIVSHVLLMRKRFEDVGRILSGAVSLLSRRETPCFSELSN